MRHTALILLLVLAGCSSPAKDAVESELIDPESAKFERVSECPSQGGMYSGLVNSKNRSGAYAGLMAFFYVKGGMVTFVDDYAFHDLIDQCFGKTGDGATAMALEWSRHIDPSRPHSQSSDITK